MKRMMGKNILKKGENPDEFHTQLYDKITKIEVQVLDRIQKLKGNSKTFICQHFEMSNPQCQSFDQNVNYFDKFWKRFLLNEIGKQYMLQSKEQLEIFQKRLTKIQNLFAQWQNELKPVIKLKKKASRMNEQNRETCEECGRAYKDKQTLAIHYKIKHQSHNRNISQDKIYESQNDSQ